MELGEYVQERRHCTWDHTYQTRMCMLPTYCDMVGWPIELGVGYLSHSDGVS